MKRVLRTHGKVVPAEIADAAAEADRIREDARRHGFQEGWQKALGSATEILARAHDEANRRLSRSEVDLKRLAVAVAEKILGAELSLRPEAVEGVVKQALDLARRRRGLTLVVHPQDATLVAALAERTGLVVELDEGIRRGGCVLKAGKVTIDARLETQLAALERALCDEL